MVRPITERERRFERECIVTGTELGLSTEMIREYIDESLHYADPAMITTGEKLKEDMKLFKENHD